MSALSDLRVDLERNEDQFGKIAVALVRLSRMLGPFGVVSDVILRLICGAEIPRSVRIGPGLRLPHGGRGIVLHWKTQIGEGVTLYHGVTLGVSGPDQGAPTIEDDVYIGTGACILGGLTVGAHSKVGANSVVLKHVPPGSTAVGVPAVIKI